MYYIALPGQIVQPLLYFEKVQWKLTWRCSYNASQTAGPETHALIQLHSSVGNINRGSLNLYESAAYRVIESLMQFQG